MKKKPQQTSFLASDANAAVQDMMSVIDQLRVVYEQETEALDKADTKTFFDLQDQKLSIARVYESGMNDLMNRRDEMRQALSYEMKRRLAEKQVEFSALAKKNIEAISRMQRCTERIGDIIRDAARETARRHRVFSYGHNGKIDVNEAKPVSTGLSETA